MGKYLTKVGFRLESGQFIQPGRRLPRNSIVSKELPDKSFILAPGKLPHDIKKTAIPVLIKGADYMIGLKRYDLTSGYAVAAAWEDGVIIPILRRTVGAEVASQQKFTKPLRGMIQKSGKVVEYWPTVVDLVQEEADSKIAEEAIEIIEEKDIEEI